MKVGFLVHQTRSEPQMSKERLVAKMGVLKVFPAQFLHDRIMPRVPVNKLRMGEARNIESAATSAKTDMVYWAESRDPYQMIRDQRIDRLVKAAGYCVDEGAELIGLGAFTSIIGQEGYGIDIQKALEPRGAWITTGNHLTGATGAIGALRLAEEVGHDLKTITAAVIGAGGSSGAIAARFLAENVKEVLLVGKQGDLSWLVAQIGRGRCRQTTMERAMAASHLIVTVTSGTNFLEFDPEILLQGAVIADIARPRDIAEIVARKRSRSVLVVDGAILNIPGKNYLCDFDYGFADRTTYACMAETMILGIENRRDHFSLGKRLDFDKAQEILRLSELHGFTLAGWRSFDQPVTSERIEEFKGVVKMGRQWGSVK